MQEGEIVQQGHFNQLKDQGFFAELLAQRKRGYSIMRALLPFLRLFKFAQADLYF